MIEKLHIKTALIKAGIVLIPSYSMAYFTDKMVFVVPTLVAAGFFATSIQLKESGPTIRVDEDADTEEDSDETDE